MNQSTLDQLTMSLKDYNETAYQLMETVSGSMEKVAILLLLLFMGINLMNWHQQLKSNGGELSFQLWIEEILKYAIALFLSSMWMRFLMPYLGCSMLSLS